MRIKKGKTYKIRGNSLYFEKKYGTSNPEIEIEDTAMNVWGKSWQVMIGNSTAMLYGMRAGMEDLPTDDDVYYGKIGVLAELVHESELVEI